MKKIFIIISLLFSWQVMAEKKSSVKKNINVEKHVADGPKILAEYNGYRFYLEDFQEKQLLSVKNQKNEILYNVDGFNFNMVNYSSNLDLLGKDKKVTVFYRDTSEANCCRNYYLVEIEPTFKLLQIINSLSSTVQIIKGENAYYLAMGDSILYHFYSSYVDGYSPKIWLSFDGTKFVFDKVKMHKEFSQKAFEDVVASVEEEVKSSKDINKRLLPLIRKSFDLVYTGNADLAFNLINVIFNKFTFQAERFHAGSWAEDKKFHNKNVVLMRPINFKYDMLNLLSCSEFKDDLLQLNKGKLQLGECVKRP